MCPSWALQPHMLPGVIILCSFVSCHMSIPDSTYLFLTVRSACKAIGVPEHDLFDTLDLLEGRNLRAVVRGLFALGRVIQVSKLCECLFYYHRVTFMLLL